jgi:ribosomal protein L16 Arg81 hydroxylase
MTSLDTTYHTVPSGLSDLVGDTGAFLAEAWASRPAVFHRGIAADFLTPTQIWAMVDRGLLVYPYFRVAKGGVPVPLADVSVTRSVQKKPLPAYADPDAVRARYADGHTLTLDEAGHWHAGTNALLDGLRADLRAEVHAAAVLAPPDATAVGESAGTHVLVVQLAGQARWQAGELAVTLHPGDVLHVPAGTRRHAVATGGDSLHLSLAVAQPNARDLAELALEAFVKGERSERIAGSHHFMTPEEKVAWLRAELAEHLNGLDLAALMDKAVRLRQRGGRT